MVNRFANEWLHMLELFLFALELSTESSTNKPTLTSLLFDYLPLWELGFGDLFDNGVLSMLSCGF
jgi:hypothetical protein